MTASRPARDAGFLAVVLLGGLAWGAATSGLQTVLPYPWSSLANAVSPWVAAAFVAGTVSRGPVLAVLGGLLVCWGETAGYYGTSALRSFPVGATVFVWLAAAMLGGPLFGAAGWSWRRAPRTWSALGAALLASVFVAEGIVVFGIVNGFTEVAVTFCVIGLAVAVGLGARRKHLPLVVGWCLLTLPLGAAGEWGLIAVL